MEDIKYRIIDHGNKYSCEIKTRFRGWVPVRYGVGSIGGTCYYTKQFNDPIEVVPYLLSISESKSVIFTQFPTLKIRLSFNPKSLKF